jgi:hypothetical protein
MGQIYWQLINQGFLATLGAQEQEEKDDPL